MRRLVESARLSEPDAARTNPRWQAQQIIARSVSLFGAFWHLKARGSAEMRDLGLFAEPLAAPAPIGIPSFRQPDNPTRGIDTAKNRAARVPLTAVEWGVGHVWAHYMSFFCCHGNSRRPGRMWTRELAVSERDAAVEPAADLSDFRRRAAVVAGCQCIGND